MKTCGRIDVLNTVMDRRVEGGHVGYVPKSRGVPWKIWRAACGHSPYVDGRRSRSVTIWRITDVTQADTEVSDSSSSGYSSTWMA